VSLRFDRYYRLSTNFIQSNSHQPITDSQGRVVAVLAPPPDDLSYHESIERACKKMANEASKFQFESKELVNPKRGNGFLALNVGLSYGNGHTKPTFRDLGRFQKLAEALLEDADIQRLASYQDGKLNSEEEKKLGKENLYIYFSSYICALASESLPIL